MLTYYQHLTNMFLNNYLVTYPTDKEHLYFIWNFVCVQLMQVTSLFTFFSLHLWLFSCYMTHCVHQLVFKCSLCFCSTEQIVYYGFIRGVLLKKIMIKWSSWSKKTKITNWKILKSSLRVGNNNNSLWVGQFEQVLLAIWSIVM